MNNEIKEILDRLERIDHKEYSCGFEFADSGSFDEDCRCFEERKKMANYITNLQQENKQLNQKYLNAVADYETTMFEKEQLNSLVNSCQEAKELKKHLEVAEPCNLKTLEDYKSYYEDTTKEQILADTYIDYCAYVNLAHRYAELKKQLEEKENIACNWKDSCLENAGKIEKLENQIKLIQQENKKYKEIIDKVIEDIKEYKEMNYSKYYENEIEIELIDKILKVLGGEEIER